MFTREQVYEALNSERAYQAYRWTGHSHSVIEYLVFIEHYLNKAKALATTEEQGPWAVLDQLRKLTALGVAAMEENGVARRAGW